jgi:hypothetical protein
MSTVDGDVSMSLDGFITGPAEACVPQLGVDIVGASG